MQYLLMIYQSEAESGKVDAAARQKMTGEYGAFTQSIIQSGNFKAGDVLFKKGDEADAMYYTVTGTFLVKEIGVELPAGRVMGELGFLAPDNRRTATVECIEDGQVLFILYDKVRELYFQDPDFGFYFLKLTSERLLQNIARLEKEVEGYKARVQELEAAQA